MKHECIFKTTEDKTDEQRILVYHRLFWLSFFVVQPTFVRVYSLSHQSDVVECDMDRSIGHSFYIQRGISDSQYLSFAPTQNFPSLASCGK
jgi:hypothetical protein